jgi:SAM-dependent methyltransferase
MLCDVYGMALLSRFPSADGLRSTVPEDNGGLAEMSDAVNQRLYDALAEHHHLIFEDWDASIRHQGEIIAKLLPQPECGPILDAACGIGTQSLALAALGYSVEGSDISSAVVARAERECAVRGLDCKFRVDDMRTLTAAPPSRYSVVMAMDNAVPHLESDEEIVTAFTAMRTRLLPTGKVVISVRDYQRHLEERPSSLPPRFYSDGGRRRIVFQIWDWIDQRRYRFHLYVTRDTSQGWITHHFEGTYRAVTTEEIADLAKRAGLREIAVLTAKDTGFYQPIIVATGA